MQNFTFFNDTTYVFGKGQIARLTELLDPKYKVLCIFGGGSVKKNGVYDQVKAALAGRDVVEFWGVTPNPTAETAREIIALGLKEKVDFLLAVGGGSVVDCTKIVAAGIRHPELDPWEIATVGAATQIPFGCVMTMPATGSEMNNGAVLSNLATKEKTGRYRGDYPRFAIVDPETLKTIPIRQRANALADIVVHCLEQYVTTPGQNRVLDRWAEGVILSTMEISSKVLSEDADYDTLCDYAYCATMALNNFLRMGITQDWVTHQIGHQLTALHGITHGESLTMIWTGTARVLREQKKGKLLQMAERIFGITEGTDDERIDLALEKMEAWFKSLGLATRLSEKGIGMETIDFLEKRFNDYNNPLGEAKNVTGAVIRQIMLDRL